MNKKNGSIQKDIDGMKRQNQHLKQQGDYVSHFTHSALTVSTQNRRLFVGHMDPYYGTDISSIAFSQKQLTL